jgi:hypothetical protein
MTNAGNGFPSNGPKEKTADSRQWYQKKRWVLPIGFLVFFGLISAITGGDSTSAPAPSPTVSQSQPEETAVQDPTSILVVPDLIGSNTEDALDELAAMGFTEANSQDASYQERNVLVDSNWFVCEIKPAPGTELEADKVVVLLSVKNTESCPAASDAEAGTEGESSTSTESGDSRFGKQSEAQLAMGEVIGEHVALYDAAENDLQRGNVKVTRDEQICSAIGGSKVSNWSGVVEDLGATSEGLGYLKIAVAKDVTLETWNNELSDIFDETLIERDSALYETLLSLSEGTIVSFSGEFIEGDGACLDTKNLTEFFSINRPEFIFRFTEINKG